MGMFDDLVKQAAAAAGGSPQHSAMASAVAGMLGSQGPGGLASLVQAFQDKGMGDVVSSWVGTGQNMPVSPDQVHAALGQSTVQQLGQQAGVSPDVAKQLLAAVLPMLIDKMTPGGQMPKEASLLQAGLNLLAGKR